MNTLPVRLLSAVVAALAITVTACSPQTEHERPSQVREPTVGDGVMVGPFWVTVTKAEKQGSFEIHGNAPLVPSGVFEVVSVTVKNPDGSPHPWPSDLSKLLASSKPLASREEWAKYPVSKQVARILDPGPEGIPVLPSGEVSTQLVFDVPRDMTVFGVSLASTPYAQAKTVLLPRV